MWRKKRDKWKTALVERNGVEGSAVDEHEIATTVSDAQVSEGITAIQDNVNASCESGSQVNGSDPEEEGALPSDSEEERAIAIERSISRTIAYVNGGDSEQKSATESLITCGRKRKRVTFDESSITAPSAVVWDDVSFEMPPINQPLYLISSTSTKITYLASELLKYAEDEKIIIFTTVRSFVRLIFIILNNYNF
jgi:hypothetical protein